MTNAIILARAQFAFTVGLHIILPAFSIGLASYLMVLEGLWLRTGRQVYHDLYNYWLKIFAVGFAMGHQLENFKLGEVINVAGTLNINEYNGQRKLQVLLKDLKHA